MLIIVSWTFLFYVFYFCWYSKLLMVCICFLIIVLVLVLGMLCLFHCLRIHIFSLY